MVDGRDTARRGRRPPRQLAASWQASRWAVSGFALWAFLIGAYWTFHLEIIPSRGTWRWVKEFLLFPYTLDEDATWAVVTHFSGFAVFVFLADRTHRKRWVFATGVVAFSFFWLLRLLQVPLELWARTTNYLGFAVMFVSSVVGLGLFSALAQVLTLLRTLLWEHPELEKQLEGTLERYPLLMIAVSSRAGGPASVVEEDEGIGHAAHADNRSAAAHEPASSCFLCGREACSSAAVCNAWVAPDADKLLPCTPYVKMRDELRATRGRVALLEAREAELQGANRQLMVRIQALHEQASKRQDQMQVN